jgi:predicted nucleic acid-binding protein
VPLLRRVQRRELSIVASVVTEAELLIRPLRDADDDAVERVQDLLSEEGISVAPVDRRTARLAAELRARHNLGLADAIIVATAIVTGCEAVVSNDGQWRRVTETSIVYLEEVAGATPASR